MTYEEQKSSAFRIIILLGIVTIVEVLIALVGKGYIGGFHWPLWLIAVIMIVLSLYKAYKIVWEFMHLGHEVPGMLKSVLLPVLLLIWAIVAFFWEGNSWLNSRTQIENKNKMELIGAQPDQSNIKSIERTFGE